MITQTPYQIAKSAAIEFANTGSYQSYQEFARNVEQHAQNTNQSFVQVANIIQIEIQH